MKRIDLEHRASPLGPLATLACRIVFAAGCACVCAAAIAQQPQKAPGGNGNAPMVKPPEPPASGASAHNPDNMPIKRPRQTTQDRMLHAPPPASAAIAK